MQKNLNAAFIFPANNKRLVREFISNLRKRFYGFQVIPVHDSKSFFDSWSSALPKVKKKYVVLTHQDVEFFSFPDLDEIFTKDIGLAGVAGSKEVSISSPWWFSFRRYFGRQLSGSIHQRFGKFINLKVPFGPCGEVEILDGVCLITKKKLLWEVGVPDNDWARWDLYDHVLCYEFKKKGYKIISVPIEMLHFSTGFSKRKNFKKMKKRFVQEYLNASM